MGKFFHIETAEIEKHRQKIEKNKRRWRYMAVLLLALSFVLLCWWNETSENPFLPTWKQLFEKVGLYGNTQELSVQDDQLRLDFIDVGNADAILVRQGNCTALIDTGEPSSADAVLSFLRLAGVERLDYLLVTHFDSDHIGAVPEVVDAFDVGKFLYAPMSDDLTPQDITYTRMWNALRDHKVETVVVKPGVVYYIGSAEWRFLGPNKNYELTNNQSVISRITMGERRFLLMGDAEMQAEKDVMALWADYLSADVLKVGHHGGETSTNKYFLNRVSPQYAVITCGVYNVYGHPHEAVIERLSDAKVTCLRSDINGRISFITDGKTLTVSSEQA